MDLTLTKPLTKRQQNARPCLNQQVWSEALLELF